MTNHRTELWWGYVKRILYYYPELKAKEKELHETAVTASYGGAAAGGQSGDMVSRAAMRELPLIEKNYVEQVEKTIREFAIKENGAETLRIIDLVYFKKTHKLYGAAQEIYTSERSARRMHSRFLRALADNLDLTY